MKKNTNTAANATNEISKAQRVRDYVANHAEATTEEVVKALKKFGVNAADVQSASRKPSNKISIEQIKLAAALVKETGGRDEAMELVANAGKAMELLKACKSVENATKAIEEAEALIASLA